MLDEHKGLDLDKRYANEMIDGHKSMIDKFEKNADKCEDPDIQGFFSSMLPDLRSHLKMAEDTKEMIKDRKDGDKMSRESSRSPKDQNLGKTGY